MLSKKDNNPDELSALFVEINEDSSHSNTFYKNRIITKYLNKLSVKLFNKVYGTLRTKRGIAFFWKEELPYIAYQCRKELYFCTAFLILCITLGVVSSYVHPEFCEQILGKGYIDMTEENIAKGDPMGVYKDSDGDLMFFRIALNNVRVSLITFISGLVAGIGSLVVMAKNGVMVGAFQYFFVQKGLFQESFLTIWMHGAIEISLIAIEGAAGFVLGKGLLLPGNLPRMTAFKLSARRGIKLLIGSIPLIVLAAVIESFVTRFTDLHDLIRLGFILLSFALVAYTFFIYPKRVAKRGFLPEVIDNDQNLTPSYRVRESNPVVIQGIAQLFSDTVLLIKNHLKKISLIFLGLAVFSSAVMTYFLMDYNDTSGYNYWWMSLGNYFFGPLMQTLNYKEFPVMFFINIITLLVGTFLSFKLLAKTSTKQQPFAKGLIAAFFCFALVTLLMQFNLLITLLAFALLPLFVNFLLFIFEHQNTIPQAFNNSFRYTFKTYFRFIGLQFFFMLLLLLVGILFNSPLFYIYNEFVQPFLFTSTLTAGIVTSFVMFVFYFFSIALFLVSCFVACSFQLKESIEIIDANRLKQKIAQL